MLSFEYRKYSVCYGLLNDHFISKYESGVFVITDSFRSAYRYLIIRTGNNIVQVRVS